MYIARNLDGSLSLFGGDSEPTKNEITGKYEQLDGESINVDKYMLPELKWGDKPVYANFEQSDKTKIKLSHTSEEMINEFFKKNPHKKLDKNELTYLINVGETIDLLDDWSCPKTGIEKHHLFNASVICKTPYEVISVKLYLRFLGYDISSECGLYSVLDDPMLNPTITVSNLSSVSNSSNPTWEEHINEKYERKFINCGDNVELFKAVVAMRDDETTWWIDPDEEYPTRLYNKREKRENYVPCTLSDVRCVYGKFGEYSIDRIPKGIFDRLVKHFVSKWERKHHMKDHMYYRDFLYNSNYSLKYCLPR